MAMGVAALMVALAAVWWLPGARDAPPRQGDPAPGAGGEPSAPPLRPAGDLALTAPRSLPDLAFVDGEGRAMTLAAFRGKVVLLNVWATWCVPCREEMPTLDRLQGTLGGPDFEVVALSIDRGGAAPVRDFYRSVGVEHLAVYVDSVGRTNAAVGAAGIPVTLVLDREGREIARKLGAAQWDDADAVAAIRKAIERPAATTNPSVPPTAPRPG